MNEPVWPPEDFDVAGAPDRRRRSDEPPAGSAWSQPPWSQAAAGSGNGSPAHGAPVHGASVPVVPTGPTPPAGAGGSIPGVPVSGAPVSGAPVSGAPVSAAPVSGAPVSGGASPAGAPGRASVGVIPGNGTPFPTPATNGASAPATPGVPAPAAAAVPTQTGNGGHAHPAAHQPAPPPQWVGSAPPWAQERTTLLPTQGGAVDQGWRPGPGATPPAAGNHAAEPAAGTHAAAAHGAESAPAAPVNPAAGYNPTDAAAEPPAASPGGRRASRAAAKADPRTQDEWIPTADEFARRRSVRAVDPIAQTGVRGAIHKASFGLIKPSPNRREQETRHDIELVRRNFGGLRQVTVVNPKGGAGKTIAVLLLATTFGQKRGGYVLAWDNNETQGTLGMRATQDFHSRTVRDLLRDMDHFRGAHGRVGDLSQYVRSQGEGMFDVLASDESATAGEMLTSTAFADIREVVSRFYKLIVVDTGNNVRAANWQSAIDATDQLVVTMSGRNDSAETAARMLDHLEQQGRHRLVRQAITVVTMPPSRRDLDIPAITRHFAARTRTVLLAPYEPLIDSGEPLRYPQISASTRRAWLKIAAAVAEGL